MPPLMPGMAGYVSSKIAAYKTMQYFAFENADKNFRVMFVHPGILGTPGSKPMVEAGFNMPNDDSESFFPLFSFSFLLLSPFPFYRGFFVLG